MKTITTLALAALLASCSVSIKEVEHKYTVISNDYKDTCEIIAKSWSVSPNDIQYDGTFRTVGNKAVFESDSGNSVVYNVNKIIAK